MKIQIIGLLLLFMISSAVSAGIPPFQGCQNLGCIGKIDRIYLHPQGDIKVPPPVGANGSNASVVGCSLSEGTYLTIKRSP